jgi:hypothetical protein
VADQKMQKLARNLSQVKQLATDVNINNYYSEIKPFLFGTDSTKPLKKEDLPTVTGIYSIANSGKMTPSEDKKIIIRVAGKTSAAYKIPNVTSSQFINDIQPDENGNRVKKPSEYFFPSDLVRILTALAKIFHQNKYNVENLANYVQGPIDNLQFVKKWGHVNSDPELTRIDSGYFYEENFEQLHAEDIKKLLQAVVDAAVAYENINERPDLAQFENRSDTINKIIEEIAPKLFQEFIKTRPEYLKRLDGFDTKFKPNLEKNENFLNDSASVIQEAVINRIKTYIKDTSLDFFRELFTPENLEIFQQEGYFDTETGYFLFQERTNPPQKGLNQSEPYLTFVEKAIKKFVESREASRLTNEFVVPLFVTETKEEPAPGATDDQEGGESQIQEENVVLDTPVSIDEFKQQLTTEITNNVVAQFLNNYIPQIYQGDFSRFRTKIENNYIQPVIISIEEEIVKNILTEFEILNEEKSQLIQQNLYALNNFDKKIFNSKWYSELLKQSTDYIQQLPSPSTEFQSYFEYLYQQYIAPAIILYEEETPEQAEAEEDVVVQPAAPAEEITGAIVPPIIPTTPVPAPTITAQTSEITRLTPEQIRTLQYESAWLYNRAIYELFTAKGTDRAEIDPVFLQNLQAQIFNYTNSMDSRDFNKLFGSAAYRQKALLEFYQKHNYDVARFSSAQELLRSTLTRNFKFDSPVLSKNIENTIDSLIIQYGLNQSFYAFDPNTKTVTEITGQNPHDIIWFIENIPPDRLALIFNLPSGFNIEDEEFVQRLKKTLIEYAKYRGSELTLHVQNITLQNGLIRISDQDAKKIQAGDQETIIKHLSFTNDLRDMTKQNGGEIIAGAIDEKPNSHRKEIQKQFKTFIPLWNQLSGEEQAVVYSTYEVPIPRKYLTNGKPDPKKLEIAQLDFITEFIFFDVRKFEEINKLAARNKKSIQEQAELIEISLIQDQLIREQKIAEYLNAVYDEASGEEELREITEFVGTASGELSFREKFSADQELEARRPKRKGFLSNRFRKKAKERLNPQEKAKKALKNASSEIASKGLSKLAAGSAGLLIPGVGTALGGALLAIKNRKVRNIVSGTILGSIAFVIGRTIWALGSIGGLVGGVVGGVGGFLAFGPAGIIPGVMIGANAGEFIIPQRWDSLIFGSSAPKPVHGLAPVEEIGATRPIGVVAPAVYEATQPPPKITKTPKLGDLINTSAGIGVVSAGAFGLATVAITLFVIFTIQSAFLIPVPLTTRSSLPVLGSYACFEFGPAGVSVHGGTSINWTQEDLNTFQAGFAIVASNNQYINLLCSAGPITVYRLPASSERYWGYVPNGTTMILYERAFDSTAGMQYVLIHETGHLIHSRNAGLVQNFNQIITDLSCYTYPFNCNDSERFAEGLVDYVTGDFFIGTSAWSGPYPFEELYPIEYNWYKNNVFGGQEF